MWKLTVMVGLPRSGKTGHAKRLGYPMVCPDSIRLAMHGKRFETLAERFVWATAHTMVRALFLAGHNNVVVDSTNVTNARRDEWRSTEWDTEYVHVTTPAEVCMARAEAVHDTQIQAVIARMAMEWEPFDPETTQFVAAHCVNGMHGDNDRKYYRAVHWDEAMR